MCLGSQCSGLSWLTVFIYVKVLDKCNFTQTARDFRHKHKTCPCYTNNCHEFGFEWSDLKISPALLVYPFKNFCILDFLLKWQTAECLQSITAAEAHELRIWGKKPLRKWDFKIYFWTMQRQNTSTAANKGNYLLHLPTCQDKLFSDAPGTQDDYFLGLICLLVGD